MKFADYEIDAESFPSFFSQIKPNTQSIKEEETSFESDSLPGVNNQVKDLKQRLKNAEFENKRLTIDLEANSHRHSKEKEMLLSQLAQSKETEAKLKDDLNKNKEEYNLFKKKSLDYETKNSFLESQLEFLTKENKRIADQHKIDKENWELKLENLKKSSKGDENDGIKTMILLNKAEAKITELNNELIGLKNKNEYQKLNYQKKMDFVENEIKKLKSEEEKYIKELEIKNKNNEEIIIQLKSRIKEIEITIEKKTSGNKTVLSKLSKRPENKSIEKSHSISEKLSKSSKSPLYKSPKQNKTKFSPINKRSNSALKDSTSSKDLKRKPPSRDTSTERASNMPTTRTHNKAPSYLRKESQIEIIESLEKEIAVLTGRYKYLLQMSQDASDLISLRTEINKIASDIENKSNQLYEFKKKHQDYLKQQIKN
jgi:hypothetical protein